MKKIGFISLAFLIIMCAYLFYINLTVGSMAEYEYVPVKYSGWKEEIKIIDGVSSLNEFLEDYSVDHSVYNEKYSHEFFRDNIILSVVITEPSSDIKHEILSLSTKDETMYIRIRRNIPDKISAIKGTRVYLIQAEREDILSCDRFELSYI